jgi:hypothetical protein
MRTVCAPYQLMQEDLAGVLKRLVVGVLVAVAVVGVSAFTIHTPSRSPVARLLKSIQTDKATLFYADRRSNNARFVEQVLPGTGESKAATDLKLVAAAL